MPAKLDRLALFGLGLWVVVLVGMMLIGQPFSAAVTVATAALGGAMIPLLLARFAVASRHRRDDR